MLRWLKQMPPHTNKWTMSLWSAAAAVGCLPLILLSFSSSIFYAPTSRSSASGAFFGSLLCFVFPMQISNLIASFTFQHFVYRQRVATTSGFSTSLQAAGRGIGTLASGIIFALSGANDGDASNPVPGFGGSVALACAVLLSSAAIAVVGYNREFGEGGLNCGPCFSFKAKAAGGGGAGGLSAAAASSPPPPAETLAAKPASALKGGKAAAAPKADRAAAAGAAAAAAAAGGDDDVEKAGVVSK